MKSFLVELDDALARDLDRVAPAKSRKRSEFVRLAIRRAIDLALDRSTAAAYACAPQGQASPAEDLAGWDEHNALARPTAPHGRPRRAAKSAA